MGWRNKVRCQLKSISVSIAKKLGFLDRKKAKQANACLQAIGDENPTLNALVHLGFLDEEQAQVVRLIRQKESPLEELNEQIKKARIAIQNMIPSR